MIKVGVLGANGRMGQALLQGIVQDKDLILAAASVRSGHALAGTPIPTAFLEKDQKFYSDNLDDLFQSSDVVIDFTLPEALGLHLEFAVKHQKPLVIGTTGLREADKAALKNTAKTIPIVYDTNMSLGITMLNALVAQAAKSLGLEFDIDVHEMHHRHKKDIPSGTAMTLADHAARGRGQALEKVATRRHEVTSLASNSAISTKDASNKTVSPLVTTHDHQKGEIGLSAKRGGGVIGDHDVTFASDEECLILSHRALSRNVFAKGALQAVKFIKQHQDSRIFNMKDVLGV